MRILRVGSDWLRLRGKDRQQRFQEIYCENKWGDDESASGAGSRLDQTETLRAVLPSWIAEFGWRSLLDVGCGDFNWMARVEVPKSLEYLGVDLVPELIERNQKHYGSSHSWTRFAVHDIVSSPPPRPSTQESFDAILCRNVLYHLSQGDAQRAIAHCVLSGASHFVATSKDDVQRNRDIPSGSFEFQNLRIPPFSLPEPERHLPDAFGESLCVWRCQQVAPLAAEWI